MSLEVLVAMVREVTLDAAAQRRYEAMTDDELDALGLNEREIASIREGFFDRALQLGATDGAGPGCCGA